MKLALQNKIYLAFGLALFILAIVDGASYRSTTQLVETSGWVTHTRQVIANIETLLSDLSRAESAGRGYLVTGKEAYRLSYREAASTVPEGLGKLRELTSDNADQQHRLDELSALIDERMKLLEASMKVRQGKPGQEVNEAVLTDRGNELAEQVRRVLGRMETEERGLLSSRTEASYATASRGHFFILLASALAFVLIGGSLVFIRRDLVGRANAERRLEIHVRREEVIANLGLVALTGGELSSFMDEVVVAVAGALGIEFSKVLELPPDGRELVMRAGLGWKEGCVGKATVSAEPRSQAGYTLSTHTPVVVEDFRTETRFSTPALLQEHGVVSGMSVVILGREKPFGVLGAHTARRRAFSEEDIHFLQAVANVLATAIERKQAEDSLRRLSTELLHSQDEERRRIARELHDSMGQSLGLLAMNLDQMDKRTDALDPKTRQILAESIDLVEGSVQEVRSLSYLLHPPLLEELGLVSALRWYVRGVGERTGIRIDLDISPNVDRLPQEVELTLFRVVQESLTNVHRHSGSPTARIRVSKDPTSVTAEISDQGRGIPAGARVTYRPGEASRAGVGIAGMKERMSAMGGQLEIRSSEAGTVVKATLPLATMAEDLGSSVPKQA